MDLADRLKLNEVKAAKNIPTATVICAQIAAVWEQQQKEEEEEKKKNSKKSNKKTSKEIDEDEEKEDATWKKPLSQRKKKKSEKIADNDDQNDADQSAEEEEKLVSTPEEKSSQVANNNNNNNQGKPANTIAEMPQRLEIVAPDQITIAPTVDEEEDDDKKRKAVDDSETAPVKKKRAVENRVRVQGTELECPVHLFYPKGKNLIIQYSPFSGQPVVMVMIDESMYLRVCNEEAAQILGSQHPTLSWVAARELEPSEEALKYPVVSTEDNPPAEHQEE